VLTIISQAGASNIHTPSQQLNRECPPPYSFLHSNIRGLTTDTTSDFWGLSFRENLSGNPKSPHMWNNQEGSVGISMLLAMLNYRMFLVIPLALLVKNKGVC